MNVKVIFSSRKTFGITVRSGEVIVRSPRGRSEAEINTLIEKHRRWIEGALLRDAAKAERFPELGAEEISALRAAAQLYFAEKCAYFAGIMGLHYKTVSITSAKSRFGSCSSSGRINFSYRLMRYPEAAREYVVVHELAHLLQMNHSKKFYKIIEKYMPDYRERRELLKVRV